MFFHSDYLKTNSNTIDMLFQLIVAAQNSDNSTTTDTNKNTTENKPSPSKNSTATVKISGNRNYQGSNTLFPDNPSSSTIVVGGLSAGVVAALLFQ